MPHPTLDKRPCIGSRCAEHSTGKHRAYPFALFFTHSGTTVATYRTQEEAYDALASLIDGPHWLDVVDTREEAEAPNNQPGGKHLEWGFLMSDQPTTAQREFGDWSE